MRHNQVISTIRGTGRIWQSVFVVLALSGCIDFRAWFASETHPDAPLLEVAAWAVPYDQENRARLEIEFLRREAHGAGALLLTDRRFVEVYRIDPSTNSVSLATKDDWQNARGPVANCYRQFGLSPGVRIEDDRLLAGEDELTAAGDLALSVDVSPSRNKALVISAEGPRVIPSFFYFGSRGYVSGRHYQQFLAMPEGQFLDTVWRLPSEFDEAQGFGICWTPDEQFVVYQDDTNLIIHDVTRGTPFGIVPQVGALTGSFTSRGIDDDENGRIDRVLIEVEVEVMVPGRYRVVISLRDSDGKGPAASAEVDLSAGRQTVSIEFHAAKIRDKLATGPYNIEFIEFSQLEGRRKKIVDWLQDAGQIQLFTRDQLDKRPIARTGAFSERGVDDSGNGRFDRLVVDLEVDVGRPGGYRWTMSLTGRSFREIETASGSGDLNQGLNTISFIFDGQAIGHFGQDGPYKLFNFQVVGPAAIAALEVGQTRAYHAAEFGIPKVFVGIDIQPEDATNRVIVGGPKELIAVAVLTAPLMDGDVTDFDAMDVDVSSLTFTAVYQNQRWAPWSLQMRQPRSRVYREEVTDVDGDGDLDRVVFFDASQLGLNRGHRYGILEGQTLEGIPLRGWATMEIELHKSPPEHLPKDQGPAPGTDAYERRLPQ